MRKRREIFEMKVKYQNRVQNLKEKGKRLMRLQMMDQIEREAKEATFSRIQIDKKMRQVFKEKLGQLNKLIK